MIRFKLFFAFLFISFSLFAESDRFRCMWRTDPATSMVVGWDQISGSEPTLYFGTTDEGKDCGAYESMAYPDVVFDFRGMKNHFVRLEGLIPNTRYYFVVKDSENTSKRYYFETLPANNNKKLSIIAGGDSRNHREARQNANKLVAKLKPHFVMFGGDMTASDNDSQWKNWFDDWQLTITREGKITPIVPARGNHEYSNKTIIELFDCPSIDVAYALSFGGDLLRVYTLNSLIARKGKQKDWLVKDLEENKNVKWKIAQYHYTTRPHTAKKSEQNQQLIHWSRSFYQYGVNLVVESDAHCVKTTFPVKPSNEKGSEQGFVRDDDAGTVYVGEGCWGAPLRPNNDDKKWTRASGSFNQFKWIFVGKHEMEIRTIKIDNAESVGNLSLQNRFETPRNLQVWTPPTGAVVNLKPIIPTTKKVVALHDEGVPMKKLRVPSMKFQVFSAQMVQEIINLSWKTMHEADGAVFNVERSINGHSYTPYKNLNGQGSCDCDEPNSYFVKDNTFVGKPIPEDLSYRIRGTFKDGTVKVYSPFHIGKSLKDFSRYDLIARDQKGFIDIAYSNSNKGSVNIRLIDNKGKVVFQEFTKSNGQGLVKRKVNIAKVSKGKYFLVIRNYEKRLRVYQVQVF